jgi:hypothetical protein
LPNASYAVLRVAQHRAHPWPLGLLALFTHVNHQVKQLQCRHLHPCHPFWMSRASHALIPKLIGAQLQRVHWVIMFAVNAWMPISLTLTLRNWALCFVHWNLCFLSSTCRCYFCLIE